MPHSGEFSPTSQTEAFQSEKSTHFTELKVCKLKVFPAVPKYKMEPQSMLMNTIHWTQLCVELKCEAINQLQSCRMTNCALRGFKKIINLF